MANKLSGSMINALMYTRDHGDPYFNCVGRSEHGGRQSTVLALSSRGLIQIKRGDWSITEAGRAALKARP